MNESYNKNNSQRYSQGDIIRNITVPNIDPIEEKITSITYPYMIIATQDCDLEQDYNNREKGETANDNDKFLMSILLLPAFKAANVKAGIHFKDPFDWQMQEFSRKSYESIKKNNNKRYHFLSTSEVFQVPELIIDFKHYCTISTNILYGYKKNETYIASISALFRESFAQRFTHYLSRIALP